MVKTLDRDIDLTSGRYFVKGTNGDTSNRNPFGIVRSNRDKFPWNSSYKLSDGSFSNSVPFRDKVSHSLKELDSLGDSHWDYLGFTYYGGEEEPFFMGNVSERYTCKMCLEEETFYNTENDFCYRCGKKLNLFDRNSKQLSLSNYMPIMCINCLEPELNKQIENDIFLNYKEDTYNYADSMTQFTIKLERNVS